MKVSELTAEQVATLDDAKKEKIIFCEIEDDGEMADFAVLLGGRFAFLGERCEAAAELYHTGRARYIIPTGGVKWPWGDGELSEAEYMRMLLMEKGVPEEAILLENEARTTKENMILASLVMMRQSDLHFLHKAYVVSSQSHMRRALTFARILLPATMSVMPYPAKTGVDSKGEWNKTDVGRQRAERELMLIKKQIDVGVVADIEL